MNLKKIETALKAVAALIAAALSIIKSIGYIERITPETA